MFIKIKSFTNSKKVHENEKSLQIGKKSSQNQKNNSQHLKKILEFKNVHYFCKNSL